MATKKTLTETDSTKQYQKVIALVEQLKADSILQFGEIKKEFGSFDARLRKSESTVGRLDRDKIERDAIEKYRHDHPELGQSNNSPINKELMKAIMQLLGVIAVLALVIVALKR